MLKVGKVLARAAVRCVESVAIDVAVAVDQFVEAVCVIAVRAIDVIGL